VAQSPPRPGLTRVKAISPTNGCRNCSVSGMVQPLRKIRVLALCLTCSVLLHILPGIALTLFAKYDFGAPVKEPPVVSVELTGAPAEPVAEAEEPEPQEEPAAPPEKHQEKLARALPAEPVPAKKSTPVEEPAVTEPAPAAAPAPAAPVANADVDPPRSRKVLPRRERAVDTARRLVGSDFLSAQQEKLTYLVSMHGFPIGSAELEASQESGATTISLRMRSNAAISSFYPVDDLIETQHIDGRFIMTKIRQQEGTFKSDEMFTINLAKKRVAWVDFLQSRSQKLNLPVDDALDTLSGIYYLRNRQLEVGKTQVLHIYDSESYADVPVEILRKEEIRLPNLDKVSTLVIRPQQKTAGIFRRTGDLLIWMTDDAYKVPVRIETTISLGKVTAELISAETKSHPGSKPTSGAPLVSTLDRPVQPR
jgi:hypothetical protein